VVICLERGAHCLHMVQLMPLHCKTPSSLASFKSRPRLILPFWYYWRTQIVLEKRSLNRCSVVVIVCDDLPLQADYVLVLVSPLYCRVVSGRTRSDDDSDSVLHARHIHDRMYAEYSASQSPSRRFVPVVMSGASSSDVPDWLRKSSQPFTWPHQYKHLMFYLIQPAQVIANYVSRRNRAFPFGRS